MIPAGTLYSGLQLSGTMGNALTGVTYAPGDVQSRLIAALQSGGFAVVGCQITGQGLGGLTASSWTGTVSVRTTFDYTDDSDVLYQVGLAIQNATGNPGTVANPAAGDPITDVSQSPISGLFGGIQKDLGIALAVVVGLAVLVIVVGGKDAIKAAVR